MQRLSQLTETVLSNTITTHRIVLSFKDSPRKPLGRRPIVYIEHTFSPSMDDSGFVVFFTLCYPRHNGVKIRGGCVGTAIFVHRQLKFCVLMLLIAHSRLRSH